MAIVITIGGIVKTSLVRTETISIDDTLNSRNNCSFELVDPTMVYRPIIGSEVIITLDSIKIFAGTIDTIDEEKIDNTNVLNYEIQCVDYNQICDRRTVSTVYENKTFQYIVKDIVDNYLVGENITYANVENGVTILKAVFAYTTVAQSFDELSDLVGYDWYIDYNKDLHFFYKTSNIAPVALTESNTLTMRVSKTRNQYRNRQYVRAGFDITSVRTDNFKGDGKLKAFVANYPLAKEPTITVDTVSKTVGIRGLDVGKDWYWSKAENEITQDDSGVVLISSNELAVTYQGLFPIIIVNDSVSEINSRSTIEGGSGIYEGIEEDQSIESQDTAKSKADGLLRRFGSIPETINLETRVNGFKAGQIVQVTNVNHQINAQYLIQSVRVNHIEFNNFSYQITALSGENIGGWLSFFKKLTQQGKKYVIRDNEVLIKLITFTDSITITETLSSTTAAAESRVGYALVGYSEVGA